MLQFEKTVGVPNNEQASVSVFVDAEKGHTVYLSHTGSLVVVEDDKARQSKTRAAGFAISQGGCSSCDGC